jgi:hypothetical protein
MLWIYATGVAEAVIEITSACVGPISFVRARAAGSETVGAKSSDGSTDAAARAHSLRSGRGADEGVRSTQAYALALIICSACLRDVSVSLAPLSMRATSSVRSSPVTGRMLVRVRPPDSRFSIT